MALTTDYGRLKNEYRQFRRNYPARLFESIIQKLNPPYESALDIGAGIGFSTFPLCQLFREVTAIEPEPALAATLKNSRENLKVHVVTGEEYEVGDTSFDLVTMGNVFHWVAGPLVVKHIANWLRPGGLLAVYRYIFSKAPEKVQRILDDEIKNHWGVHKDPHLADKDYPFRVITESGLFDPVERQRNFHVENFSTESLVGYFKSVSYCHAYLQTLDKPNDYLENLITSLQEVSDNNLFALDFELELILAKKPKAT